MLSFLFLISILPNAYANDSERVDKISNLCGVDGKGSAIDKESYVKIGGIEQWAPGFVTNWQGWHQCQHGVFDWLVPYAQLVR